MNLLLRRTIRPIGAGLLPGGVNSVPVDKCCSKTSVGTVIQLCHSYQTLGSPSKSSSKLTNHIKRYQSNEKNERSTTAFTSKVRPAVSATETMLGSDNDEVENEDSAAATVDADENRRDMKQERDYVSKEKKMSESLLASCTVPATSEARLPTSGGISLLSVSDESLVKVNVEKQKRKNFEEESEKNILKETNTTTVDDLIDQDEALLREHYKKTTFALGKLLAITSTPSLVCTATIWACEYSSHFQHLPPEFLHEPIPAIVTISGFFGIAGMLCYVVKILENPGLSETQKLNQVYYLHGFVGLLITPLSGLFYVSHILPQAALLTSALVAVPITVALLMPPPRRMLASRDVLLLVASSIAVAGIFDVCCGDFDFHNRAAMRNGVEYCLTTLFVGHVVLFRSGTKWHHLEVASVLSLNAVIMYMRAYTFLLA
jgi:hypothetical protein